MSRIRHLDILVELIELCHENMDEVRQQLTYYRASVYKDETARLVVSKIERLRLLAALLGDDMIQEAFKDHDAMAKAGAMNYVPGECSFSKRVSCLLQALDEHLTRLARQIANRTLAPAADATLTDAIRKHRSELLALCRHGSRQWAFFQSL